MVYGLEVFKDYFKGYEEQYVLIGGAACDIAMRVNVIEQFVPIVEWGQQEGTIREGEPLIISNAFWCSIQGIAERYATNQDVALPKAEWIVDIVRRK